MKFDSYITDGQLEFIKWVRINHINELEHYQRNMVERIVDEVLTEPPHGYMNHSLWQIGLNEIRNLYLKEYKEYIKK